jgi:uncharacterized membrane protein YfcA
MVFLPFGFLLAGLLSSLLGIGSGMVKAPILVELGLEPAVGAATSTFMVIIFLNERFYLLQYPLHLNLSCWVECH